MPRSTHATIVLDTDKHDSAVTVRETHHRVHEIVVC
jgi:hypothetical protein